MRINQNNMTATIEEEDVGVAATTAFHPFWPLDGWAGEITAKDVGKSVLVGDSAFAALAADKVEAERKKEEARIQSAPRK